MNRASSASGAIAIRRTENRRRVCVPRKERWQACNSRQRQPGWTGLDSGRFPSLRGM
jgi:hypothetical protein